MIFHANSIFMKNQSLFPGKNKKNIVCLLSAEIALRMVMIQWKYLFQIVLACLLKKGSALKGKNLLPLFRMFENYQSQTKSTALVSCIYFIMRALETVATNLDV